MTITYPESWELVTLPETESFKSMSGEYEISYTHEDNRITIERSVTINYNKIYLPEKTVRSKNLKYLLIKYTVITG